MAQSSLSVLLVSRESPSSHSRSSTVSLLRECGHQVQSTSSSREAIELLRKPSVSYDIVIKDIDGPMDSAPDSNASRFMRAMANSQLIHQTPVIFISSCHDQEMVMKCLSLGACDYLIKPLRANEMRHIWTKVYVFKRNQDPRNQDIDFGPDSLSGDSCLSSKRDDDSEPTSKEGSNPREIVSNPMDGSNGDGSGNNSGNNASASKYVHHHNTSTNLDHPHVNVTLTKPSVPLEQLNHAGHHQRENKITPPVSRPVVSKPVAIARGKGSLSNDIVAIKDKSEDTNVILLPPSNQPGGFLPAAPSLPHASVGLAPGADNNMISASLGIYQQLMIQYAKRGGALAQMQQAYNQQLHAWQQHLMILAANAQASFPSSQSAPPQSEDLECSPTAVASTDVLSKSEARALALQRYRNKRRNLKFRKTTVRYESRKQLAQTRPRVRGQFASFPATKGPDEIEREDEDEEEDREEDEEPVVKKMRGGCEGQNFNNTGDSGPGRGCSQNVAVMRCGEAGDGRGSGSNAEPGPGEGTGMIPAQSGSRRKRKQLGRSGSDARGVNAANLQLSGNVEEDENVVNSLMKLRAQLAGVDKAEEGERGEGRKGKSGSGCSGSNSPNSDENASGGEDRSGQGSGGGGDQ